MHQPQIPGGQSSGAAPRDYTREELDDLFGGMSHPALGGVFIALMLLALAAF